MPKDLEPSPQLARKEAFEHYYRQGLTPDSRRTLKATALAMKLSVATISQWARQDQWEQKVITRDKKVDDKLDEIAVEKVVQVKARYCQSIGKVLDTWFSEHFGTEEQAKLSAQMMDSDQAARLMKLWLVMSGHPDTIRQIENNVSVSVEDKLGGLSEQELRAIIKASKDRDVGVEITIEPTNLLRAEGDRENNSE